MTAGPILTKHNETIDFVDDDLPNLRSSDVAWDQASDPTEDYNCMGLAVGLMKWLSPPKAPGLIRNPRDYWPPFITDDEITVEAFIEAAEVFGFKCCDDPSWEVGYCKIVLCSKGGDFTHAAIQVSPDKWKSKFGGLSDFEHTLSEIEGCKEYGNGRQFMRREVNQFNAA